MAGGRQPGSDREGPFRRKARLQPAMNPSREPNTGTLLLYAFKSFDRELFGVLATAGHDRLRSRHGAVLANLDADGTRASVLARRAGIGTSAVGEVVDDLERLGYVERRADPADRRAKLVVPTEVGLAVVRLAARTIEQIERRYLRTLGETRYEGVRRALADIAEAGPPGRR